ncbi:MAG: hypothetical protein ACJ74W_05610 [Pyrinomonadaceae bacterium]
MNEQTAATDAPLSEPTSALLKEVRHKLLRQHKVLLDDERAAYERVHGRVPSGELLQLVISDEQFAWLHALSELIVRIDELFDEVESTTEPGAQSLLTQARALLVPADTGGEFARKYQAALQREPAAVLAHAELARLLATKNAKQENDAR